MERLWENARWSTPVVNALEALHAHACKSDESFWSCNAAPQSVVDEAKQAQQRIEAMHQHVLEHLSGSPGGTRSWWEWLAKLAPLAHGNFSLVNWLWRALLGPGLLHNGAACEEEDETIVTSLAHLLLEALAGMLDIPSRNRWQGNPLRPVPLAALAQHCVLATSANVARTVSADAVKLLRFALQYIRVGIKSYPSACRRSPAMLVRALRTVMEVAGQEWEPGSVREALHKYATKHIHFVTQYCLLQARSVGVNPATWVHCLLRGARGTGPDGPRTPLGSAVLLLPFFAAEASPETAPVDAALLCESSLWDSAYPAMSRALAARKPPHRTRTSSTTTVSLDQEEDDRPASSPQQQPVLRECHWRDAVARLVCRLAQRGWGPSSSSSSSSIPHDARSSSVAGARATRHALLRWAVHPDAYLRRMSRTALASLGPCLSPADRDGMITALGRLASMIRWPRAASLWAAMAAAALARKRGGGSHAIISPWLHGTGVNVDQLLSAADLSTRGPTATVPSRGYTLLSDCGRARSIAALLRIVTPSAERASRELAAVAARGLADVAGSIESVQRCVGGSGSSLSWEARTAWVVLCDAVVVWERRWRLEHSREETIHGVDPTAWSRMGPLLPSIGGLHSDASDGDEDNVAVCAATAWLTWASVPRMPSDTFHRACQEVVRRFSADARRPWNALPVARGLVLSARVESPFSGGESVQSILIRSLSQWFRALETAAREPQTGRSSVAVDVALARAETVRHMAQFARTARAPPTALEAKPDPALLAAARQWIKDHAVEAPRAAVESVSEDGLLPRLVDAWSRTAIIDSEQ